MNEPLFSENNVRNAAQFSNFAQRVKMKYWGDFPASKVPEIYLDEILLLVWEDFRKNPKANV